MLRILIGSIVTAAWVAAVGLAYPQQPQQDDASCANLTDEQAYQDCITQDGSSTEDYDAEWENLTSGMDLSILEGLPAESREHLRKEFRAKVIAKVGRWDPSAVGESFDFDGSDLAAQDPVLGAEEELAWVEMLDQYHKRERLAYERSGGQGPAQVANQARDLDNLKTFSGGARDYSEFLDQFAEAPQGSQGSGPGGNAIVEGEVIGEYKGPPIQSNGPPVVIKGDLEYADIDPNAVPASLPTSISTEPIIIDGDAVSATTGIGQGSAGQLPAGTGSTGQFPPGTVPGTGQNPASSGAGGSSTQPQSTGTGQTPGSPQSTGQPDVGSTNGAPPGQGSPSNSGTARSTNSQGSGNTTVLGEVFGDPGTSNGVADSNQNVIEGDLYATGDSNGGTIVPPPPGPGEVITLDGDAVQALSAPDSGTENVSTQDPNANGNAPQSGALGQAGQPGTGSQMGPDNGNAMGADQGNGAQGGLQRAGSGTPADPNGGNVGQGTSGQNGGQQAPAAGAPGAGSNQNNSGQAGATGATSNTPPPPSSADVLAELFGAPAQQGDANGAGSTGSDQPMVGVTASGGSADASSGSGSQGANGSSDAQSGAKGESGTNGVSNGTPGGQSGDVNGQTAPDGATSGAGGTAQSGTNGSGVGDTGAASDATGSGSAGAGDGSGDHNAAPGGPGSDGPGAGDGTSNGGDAGDSGTQMADLGSGSQTGQGTQAGTAGSGDQTAGGMSQASGSTASSQTNAGSSGSQNANTLGDSPIAALESLLSGEFEALTSPDAPMSSAPEPGASDAPDMDSISVATKAQLAAAAYESDDPALPSNGPPEGYTEIDKIELDNGFSATAFQGPNGDIAIAYRGTNDGEDIYTDLQMGLSEIAEGPVGELFGMESGESILPDDSNFNESLTAAQEFTDKILADNPDADVSLVGHSLGGSIASVEGARTGLETDTFNAPGTKNIVENRYPDADGSNVDNHKRSSDGIAASLGEPFGSETFYPDAGDDEMGIFDSIGANHGSGDLADDLANGMTALENEPTPYSDALSEIGDAIEATSEFLDELDAGAMIEDAKNVVDFYDARDDILAEHKPRAEARAELDAAWGDEIEQAQQEFDDAMRQDQELASEREKLSRDLDKEMRNIEHRENLIERRTEQLDEPMTNAKRGRLENYIDTAERRNVEAESRLQNIQTRIDEIDNTPPLDRDKLQADHLETLEDINKKYAPESPSLDPARMIDIDLPIDPETGDFDANRLKTKLPTSADRFFGGDEQYGNRGSSIVDTIDSKGQSLGLDSFKDSSAGKFLESKLEGDYLDNIENYDLTSSEKVNDALRKVDNALSSPGIKKAMDAAGKVADVYDAYQIVDSGVSIYTDNENWGEHADNLSNTVIENLCGTPGAFFGSAGGIAGSVAGGYAASEGCVAVRESPAARYVQEGVEDTLVTLFYERDLDFEDTAFAGTALGRGIGKVKNWLTTSEERDSVLSLP